MPQTKTFDELAVFGGTPRFSRTLHVGRPNIADVDGFYLRLHDALQRRWLTNDGRYVRQLEEQIASHVGARHAIAVCNATLGLQLVAKAAGLTGEVIVPSFTFIATAHAFSWIGLKPVFADVAPGSHNIDPAHAESLITPRTSAIAGVHLWGQPCDVEALSAIARLHGLALLFDAAHALGASHGGRMIGGYGLAEVFSLHATKFVNALEGGVICTGDDALADRLRQMRDFGYDDRDEIVSVGINAKMDEASAAMGVGNMDCIEELIGVNRRNWLAYERGLQDVPGVRLRTFDRNERNNYQYIVLEVDPAETGISRDVLLAILEAENVSARRYFYPGVHRCQPYAADRATSLPVTERLVERVMQLPTGTDVSEEEATRLAALVSEIVQNGPEIQRRLAGPNA